MTSTTSDARDAREPARRDSAASRRAILDAAADLFCRSGYDGAGTRDIARAAGVDARLITRYFGSKEQLFAEVVDELFAKTLLMTPEHTAEAATELLTAAPPARDGMILTLRSAANPRAAEIMREHVERHYQRELAEGLPGADDRAGRAALLIAICAGVQLMRNVLHDEALTDARHLAPYLRKALDAVAYEDS
ncbi:TetR/AcrR family transcriptional regulator [Asanoa iriomotensis]|uniref:TetR family transcriptional regulator n=1 Tax=Asanoa iriomotensis TaxID=234613 RepID=A0ABQ4C1G5_9ACTN|nr:TetR/AcrR family transcriptional regulator [Asanoa iriomotensis]GIF56614.1 TetR family transcriptional regulator [Asanoa iriomotensis]